MSHKNWQYDELVLAFNLYCKLPFGKYHQRNPQVVGLAGLLGRSPGAVAMKLGNLASLDPYHKARGVHGLANASEADRLVWSEFHSNWERLGAESEARLAEFSPQPTESMDKPPLAEVLDAFTGPTEAERLSRVRLGQRFFRTMILAGYRCRCCVCGIPIRRLLVASHIVPWSERPDLRVDPHNGLCLCALHDKAFDTGLLAIEPNYTVAISPEISAHLPNDALSSEFVQYAGNEIMLPDKFLPDPEYLDQHCRHVFKGKV